MNTCHSNFLMYKFSSLLETVEAGDVISIFVFFGAFYCYTFLEKLSSCISNDHEEGMWMVCCELVVDKCQCMFSGSISDEQ